MRIALLPLLILPLFTIAQKKKITLEDIYKKNTFASEFVPGFITPAEDYLFNPADVVDPKGKKIETGDYLVSPDKKQIIFFVDREKIYRRSSKSTVYVYDVATKKSVQLNQGKVLHPSFSPDGSKLAYVFDNNLYIYDIATAKTKAVTTDGKWNYIINGNCDWVYEEEFEFTRAYEWSPKGNYIAYYKFDESRVKEYSMTIYDGQYNKQYNYKYPKAGEENSKVQIHIYELATGKDIQAQFEQGDIYIPRIKWTRQDDRLVVYWMNRHQDHLRLLLTDASTGAAKTLYEEKNKYFVEINDNWWFLNNGKNFLFTSEMNGYTQLYNYSMDGKKKDPDP